MCVFGLSECLIASRVQPDISSTETDAYLHQPSTTRLCLRQVLMSLKFCSSFRDVLFISADLVHFLQNSPSFHIVCVADPDLKFLVAGLRERFGDSLSRSEDSFSCLLLSVSVRLRARPV